MARISSYPRELDIADNDAWIGTESLNRSTKNFTAATVAKYLNINGKISISAQMGFKFILNNSPANGEFSGPADNSNIGDITTLQVSSIDTGGQNTVQFMGYLIGSDILISKQNDINTFGHFTISSYVANGAGVYTLSLALITGGSNGILNKNVFYDFAVFTLSTKNIDDLTYNLDVPTGTTSINLAGSDGTNDAVELFGGTNIGITRDNANRITFTGSAITAGTGIAIVTTSIDETISINYSGTDNAILSATQYLGTDDLLDTDVIWFNQASNAVANTVSYAQIGSLPFDEYNYWVLSDGSIGEFHVASTNTAKILGGTYITSFGSAADKSVTITHNATTRTNTTPNPTLTPSPGGTVGLVTAVASNTEGHVTGTTVTDVTWPADTDTNYILNKAAGSTDLILSADGTTQNTIQFAGTTNEVTVTGATEDAYQIGLPDEVTIATSLTVGGTVQSSFGGQVTIPATPSVATDAASKSYVLSQVGGLGTFQGGYDATSDPGSPVLTGISNIAVGTGDFYTVTTAGAITFSDSPTGDATLEVGDFIFANSDIVAGSNPASTDYTLVLADQNIAGAGTTDGNTAKGIAGFNSAQFSVSPTGWVQSNNNGTVTGTGVANKVAYWTSATNIDDGPITFSTNDSTFAGDVTINKANPYITLNDSSAANQQLTITQSGSTANFQTRGGASTKGQFIFKQTDGTTSSNALIINQQSNATFIGTVTAPTFIGDLTGTVNATSILADGVTATTQSALNGSTKVATTAYADAAASAVPIGDYLPLAGGALTGATSITVGTNTTTFSTTANQLIIKNSYHASASGLALRSSNDTHCMQLYGEAVAYGFLASEWGAWNLRKVVSGGLYLNDNNTYFVQPEGTSNMNAATFAGNVTAQGGVDITGTNNTNSTLRLTNTAAVLDNSWSLVPQYNNPDLTLLEGATTRVTFKGGSGNVIFTGDIKINNTTPYLLNNDDEILTGSDAGGYYFGLVTSANASKALFIGDHNNYIRFDTDGDEKMRIAANGAIGIGGANYGTSGQVLTSNGNAAPSWQAAGGSSPWTTSGNNIYNNNSGNVGIGTSSPNAKLDVQGSLGQLFSVTDNLTGSIFAVSDISGVPILDVNSSGVSYFDGKVGIGQASPESFYLYYNNLVIGDGTGDNGMAIYSGINDRSTLAFMSTYTNSAGLDFEIRVDHNNSSGFIETSFVGDGSDNWMRFEERQFGQDPIIRIGNNTIYSGVGGSAMMQFRPEQSNWYSAIAINAEDGGGNGKGFIEMQSNRSSTYYADYFLKFFNYNASEIGSIRVNNSNNNVAFNISSDYRLKEDLKEFKALETICKIKVYNYTWKDDPSGFRDQGILAHELDELIPQAVSGEKDAIDKDNKILAQGIDYSKIVPHLVQSIQELKAEIEILKNK